MFKILDTFCKAGGCSEGYRQAGFKVVGVDIEPQKNYPFEFHQADALEYIKEHWREFDAIAASPPCQKHSIMTRGRWQNRLEEHVDLVAATRDILIYTGLPYVIENVPGSPLRNPVMLCGTMFGLQTKYGSQLQRHRLFETNFHVGLTPPCNHKKGSVIGVYGSGQHPERRKMPATVNVYGSSGGYSKRDKKFGFTVADRRDAMGIDWMTGKELSQAIPPAYTKWIGEYLIKHLERKIS